MEYSKIKRCRVIPAFLLLGISALLSALAFPNPLIQKGLPFALWFAYTGVFFCIKRMKPCVCLLAGAFFGVLSVTLQNYWLSFYHPLAGIFAALLFAFEWAVFFLLLKIAGIFFHKRAAPAQCALWVCFEWFRTFGFTGYSYGIAGYSQWSFTPLIICANLGGVWLVSAVIILPQAVFGNFAHGFTRASLKPSLYLKLALSVLPFFFALLYGFFYPVPEVKKRVPVALIQPDSSPWKSNLNEFRRELENLKRLSDEALAKNPPPELVVWPETAFVPSFYFHDRYRPDQDFAALVLNAKEYLASKNVPFVLGNNEGRVVLDENGIERTASYNAVLLFDGGEFKNRYYKTRLVPFAESFPYKRFFPAFYNFLIEHDSRFWDAGKEIVVFDAAGVPFSTPICFEDTFGELSREGVRRGAELIVNLSNDSWAGSQSAQWTHLGAAAFRAVETGRAMVRATTSGQSCAIDYNGRILDMAAPFKPAYIVVDAPVYTHTTLYTRIGDTLPIILLLCVLAAAAVCFIKRAVLKNEAPRLKKPFSICEKK
ncbi:MAG: apolipoprotein N-acyltransferase [Spirochaetaceae bacterium]|nr:apolipoprotein N-acyltransferase [Spirochaetaceae bacterium]